MLLTRGTDAVDTENLSHLSVGGEKLLVSGILEVVLLEHELVKRGIVKYERERSRAKFIFALGVAEVFGIDPEIGNKRSLKLWLCDKGQVGCGVSNSGVHK